jgi:2-phospho-L-lactate guanylyltransferase
MTIALLVPVKNLAQAKTRLAPLLTAEERTQLALTMLRGTLQALSGIRAAQRKVVVTNFEPAMHLAATLGFAVMREGEQRSESESVDAASLALEQAGMQTVLRIPLDLPLIHRADVEAVLAAGQQGAAAVLVPSASGTGTNGLLRSPPTLFHSRFGPGSLALHEQEARRATPAVRILPRESLALDIDDEDDVREFLRRNVPCATRDFLRGIGIEARLDSRQTQV